MAESTEHRTSKRRKLQSLPSNEPPYIAQLSKLNTLTEDEFRETYLPASQLTINSPKLSDASFCIDFYFAETIPTSVFRKCYDLLRFTSEIHYRNSSRGWYPNDKKAEMKYKDMKYLIVRRHGEDLLKTSSGSSESNPLKRSIFKKSSDDKVNPEEVHGFGYLSFQLDDDNTADPKVRVPVLYVYEIHLGDGLRGLGIGKHLMRITEHIAKETGMDKVILSVFTTNENAEQFYRSMGYITDETSPPSRKLRRGKVVEPDWKALSLAVK
jgi:ribosomal protein S18 acetylase RimI-like enzyme